MSKGKKLVRVPPDDDLTFLFTDPEAIGIGCNLGALASEEAMWRPDRATDARMTEWRVGWAGRTDAEATTDGERADLLERRELEDNRKCSLVTRVRRLRRRFEALDAQQAPLCR